MDARGPDPRDLVKLAAFSGALAVYVYVIGWLVTWVRLTAARLPVDASLPVIDDKVLLATGLRTVLLMAAAFAAMCAVAWAAHAWTWDRRSPEWHADGSHAIANFEFERSVLRSWRRSRS